MNKNEHSREPIKQYIMVHFTCNGNTRRRGERVEAKKNIFEELMKKSIP